MNRWNSSLRPFVLAAAIGLFAVPAAYADTLACPYDATFYPTLDAGETNPELTDFVVARATPTAGVYLRAESSDPATVSISPASVRLAAGKDEATFKLSPKKPSANTVTITVYIQGDTDTGARAEFPVKVSGTDTTRSILIGETVIEMAENSTKNVSLTLGTPAPDGGVTLNVAGSTAETANHVSFPATVFIAQNATVGNLRLRGLDGDFDFSLTLSDAAGNYDNAVVQGSVTNLPPTILASTDAQNPTPWGQRLVKNQNATFTWNDIGGSDVSADMDKLSYRWSFAATATTDKSRVFTNAWTSASADGSPYIVWVEVSDGDASVRGYFAVSVEESVTLYTDTTAPWAGLQKKGGIAELSTFAISQPAGVDWDTDGSTEVAPGASVKLSAVLEAGSYPFGWFGSLEHLRAPGATHVPNPNLNAYVTMPTDGDATVFYFASYPYYHTVPGKGAANGLNPVLTDPFGDFDADGLSDTWEDYHFPAPDGVEKLSENLESLPVGIPTGEYGPTGNLDEDWLPTSLYQPAPDGPRKIGWPAEDPNNPGVTNRYRVYKYPLDFSTGGESYNKSDLEEKPLFGNFIEYRGLAENQTGDEGEDPTMFVYYAPEIVDANNVYGPRGNCSGTDPENYDTDADGFSDGWEFYFWTTIKYRVNSQNWRAWDPTYSLYRTASATAGIPLLRTEEPVDFSFPIGPTESYVIDPAAGTHQTTYEVDKDVVDANNLIMPVKPGSVQIVFDNAENFTLWTIPGRMTSDGRDALFYQQWADVDGDGVLETPAVDEDGNPIPAELNGAWVDDTTGFMHVPGWTVLSALSDTGAAADIDQDTTAMISYVRLNGIFTHQHLLSRFDPMNWTETDMGVIGDVVEGLGLDRNKWDPDSDLDGDGVLDIEEYYLGTDPLHWDTDRDGMPDGWEVQRGLLPRDPRNGVNGCGPGDNPDEDYMAVATGVLGEAMVGSYTHIYAYLADLNNRRYWNGLSYVGFVPGRAATGGTGFSNREEFLVSLYGFQTGFWWDVWRLPLGYDPVYTDADGVSRYALGIYPIDWPQTTSNPCDNDTNRNGIPDGWELYVGWNPIDGNCVTPLSFPPEDDPDGDNLSLRQEFSCVEVTNRWPETRTIYIGANATVTQNESTTVDADGTTNTVYSTTGEGTEVTIRAFPLAMPAWTNKKLPTDPWNSDTDGDGLSDMQEYTDEMDRNGDGAELANFNPCSADTDLDWLPDPWEWFMGTYTTDHPSGVSTTDPYGPFGDPDGDGLPNYQEYLTGANYAWRHDKWYNLDNQKIWIPQKRPELGDLDDKYGILQGDWPYDPGLFPDLGPVVKAHPYQPMDFFAVPESPAWINEGILALRTIEKRWAVTDAVDQSPSLHYETVAAFFQRLTEIVMNPFSADPLAPSKFMDDTRPSVDPNYNTDKVDVPGKKYFQYHTPEEHWAIVHAYEGLLGHLYSYAQCPYPWDTAARNNTPSGVLWTYIPLNDNTTVAGFPGTRPKELDSDHDNMPDYWEIYHGLNPIYGGCIGISDKAGSVADTDWDGADNWIMGNDPNFVLNLHLVPTPQPVSRFAHSWVDEDRIEHTFGDGEDTAFGGILERAHYDLVLRPWLAGDPSADCDHDGLNNQEESYSVFANDLLHNTDPSPYWLTDISQTYAGFGQKASHVNLYYTSLGFGDDPADYWWWEQPYTGNDACNGVPTYLWDFEINEGYDSDNNNISDREELTDVSTRGKTDPQDLDNPRARKAMYFDGHAACRTQRPFFHDQYALTSFTLEFWVRPEELPAPGKIATLLQRPVMMPVDTISGAKAWDIRHTFLVYLNDKGEICAEVDNDGIEQPANKAVVSSSGRLVPNVWTHVALVMDSRGDHLTLYLNGTQAGQIATSLKPCTGTIMDSSYQNWVTSDGGENGVRTVSTTTVNFQYSPAPIVIGAYDTTPWSVIGLNPDATFDQNRFFKGWIDEVRIWDRCRTGTEIVNNMTKRFSKTDFESINQARFRWDMEHLYQTNSEDDFPQKLLYLFNFDNLPDVVPAATRGTALVFASDTDPLPAGWSQTAATRPIPYVPWWYVTKNRSTVYSTDYAYVPFIENVVSHMPQRPPRGVKELMPVFDGEWNLAGYRYRLSADWSEEMEADIVAGEQVVGDVAYQYEENGATALIAPTRLTNTMDPYGDTYSTGVSGQYEVSPWNFAGILDPYGVYEGVPIHSDMVPLLDAVADMDVPMWDGYGRGTDVNALDTDGDGLPDWWEIANGLDPNLANGINGAYGDSDNDGLDNYAEYLAGTDPHSADTNSDGYSDYYSRVDASGLTFGELYDDGDGMNNAWEIENGLDPDSYDANLDSDNDGWTNQEEFLAGTNPNNPSSFPTPDFSVTYYYPDQNRTEGGVTHYLWTYAEKTTGGDMMGGSFDGEYSRPSHLVGEIGMFGVETRKIQGAVWYAKDLDFGHVATAKIEIWEPSSTNASSVYELTAFNPEVGQFVDDKESKLYLQMESGTLLYSADFVGKMYSIDYSLDGYAYPVTFNGLVRTKDTHVVSGPNRFFGFIDRNSNGTYDLDEPAGLSISRPTLVGWDSVSTDVYLTDDLWNYPRVSWAEEASQTTNFVPTAYLVTFTYLADSSARDETDVTTNETTSLTGNGIVYGDLDGDGLDSYQEARAGTVLNNAFSADSTKKRLDYDVVGADGLTYGEKYDDGDLMPVQWEAASNIDTDRFDADSDPDDDGWSNYEEYIGKTWPNVARSFPMPVMELKFLYAGEQVTNHVLVAQTYSERKQGTYIDGNNFKGICMGGLYDGQYATAKQYNSVWAIGAGANDEYGENAFIIADGIIGEDGVQTVQNIEFGVSYISQARIEQGNPVALQIFSLDDPETVVAQGLLGTAVKSGVPDPIDLHRLNEEIGVFYLSSFYGFTVTNQTAIRGTPVGISYVYDNGNLSPVTYYDDGGHLYGYDWASGQPGEGYVGDVSPGDQYYLQLALFKYETGAILSWGTFSGYGYRVISGDTIDGFIFPVTIGAWYRDDGTPNPIASWYQNDEGAHTHTAGGYNRILGFSDVNKNEQWDPGEPMGLSLYNSVYAGPDSFTATIPLTDQLWGFPRIAWAASSNAVPGQSFYRVVFSHASGALAADIRVPAPRTFLHEGDFIKAGIRGLNLGALSSEMIHWTATLDEPGSGLEILSEGDVVYQAVSEALPRRTMEAVSPIAASTVYGSLVEFQWKMDWRNEGVFFTVKDSSGTAVAGLDNLYVPFPVRHNKVTDEDYYYTYVPQLENGRTMVSLPSGLYTYEIRENIRTTAVAAQKVTGSFRINNEQDWSRTCAAIKGHVHYFGRLPYTSVPGKVVVQAYKVSNRARTSLSVGGNPVARTTVASDGSFELHGLKPGAYGLIGWVDADNDGRFKDADTKGFGFLGGSASPIQVPDWCIPIVITNAPDHVACNVEDVHIVLRDRDTDANGVPNDDGFAGKLLADYKTMPIRTFPNAIPAGVDWISLSLFSTTSVRRATMADFGYDFITKQFAVMAPRTFLHEWDLARTGLYGFNLGKTNVINVGWTVDAMNGPWTSRIANGSFVVDAGQSPASSTDPRRSLRAVYPTQLTSVNGNYVEFKWEMDWRNAGVKIGITNIVTGEGVERTVPFPVRHGKTTTRDYYFTAIPQLEDGVAFLDLPRDPDNFFTNRYTYTITEMPRTRMFVAQSVTERFTLISDDSSRARYSIEGNVKYFGKLMVSTDLVELGSAATGETTFSATIPAANLSELVPGATAVQLRNGDDLVCTFSDRGGTGALSIDGAEESLGWSGSIDYEKGDVYLRFSEPLSANCSVHLVLRKFPESSPLYIRAYKVPDSSSSAVSVSGMSVAQVKKDTKGGFTLMGLEQGTYAIHAFIDSNGSGYAEEWETQGYGIIAGTDAPVKDSKATAIVVNANVKNVMIVLHDRDTDNDQLPDSWEYWKFGNLATSGHDEMSPGLAVWEEYADGVLDSDPRTPDTDLDGLTDAMEIKVTRTDTHKRDTDNDGIGDLEEFLSGSDPLDPNDAHPFTTPALAFDADGVPYVECAYPELVPGVVLTYTLQRKLELADPAWEDVAELEVAATDMTPVMVSDGVMGCALPAGSAVMKPADQADIDYATGFFRIRVGADYGKMVENGDGTCSYMTWVAGANGSWSWAEAARGTGTLVRNANGTWNFVSDATGRKASLVRDENGNWTFQE